MNDMTRTPVRPEVAAFVDRVRAQLADLSDDEREELIGGLEADLSERLADGGGVADLGDPRAYAEELRTAAGLERTRRRLRVPRPRGPGRPVAETLAHRLDDARLRWEQLMATGPWLVSSWAAAQTMRPVWWVLRAWVAVQLLDIWSGPWEWPTLIPRFGDDWMSLLLLAAAVGGSVMLGLRHAGSGGAAVRSVRARVVLLVLNLFAVGALAIVAERFPSAQTLNDAIYVGYRNPAPVREPGLRNDGRLVRNVFAYDAEGKPVQGIQLFDQTGRPLAIDPDRARRMRYQDQLPMIYAWQNGDQQLWNVFPLPLRTENNGWTRKDRAWGSANPPVLPTGPMVAVPPATLPTPTPVQAESTTPDERPVEPEPKRDRQR